jgi:hypothetical protein
LVGKTKKFNSLEGMAKTMSFDMPQAKTIDKAIGNLVFLVSKAK